MTSPRLPMSARRSRARRFQFSRLIISRKVSNQIAPSFLPGRGRKLAFANRTRVELWTDCPKANRLRLGGKISDSRWKAASTNSHTVWYAVAGEYAVKFAVIDGAPIGIKFCGDIRTARVKRRRLGWRIVSKIFITPTPVASAVYSGTSNEMSMCNCAAKLQNSSGWTSLNRFVKQSESVTSP